MSLCQARSLVSWFCGALVAGLVATACGASDGTTGGDLAENAGAGSSHSAAGEAGSGGSHTTGRGGSGGKSGAPGAGGATNGGSGASGGDGAAASSGAGNASGSSGTAGSAGASGAAPTGGCRRNDDCEYESPFPGGVGTSTCLSPGQSPPGPSTICGAPQWCGRCDCPEQPLPLEGEGEPCETSAECPAGDGDLRAASACVDRRCSECGEDADCPAELPACTLLSPFDSRRTCVACTTSEHCPAERPHCIYTNRSIGGECWPCGSSADCEEGICSAGGCVPGCTSDDQCSPLTRCTNQRCEAIACEDSSVCPVNAECRDGVCLRIPCALDQDCPDGVCVNAACNEKLGSCFTQTAAP